MRTTCTRNRVTNTKLTKSRGIWRKKRHGAAAVEFAIVAPIFFLLIFGIIEIGRAVMVQQIITNASREGARRAVLEGATVADVSNIVTTYLANASLPSAAVAFPQGNPESVSYGNPVEVRVSIPYAQVNWLPTPLYLSGQTLQASTVMRRETM